MKIRDKLKEDLHLPGFVSDILFVVVVIGVISAVSQLALGLWTPMVAVESGSMVPQHEHRRHCCSSGGMQGQK